MASTEGFEPRYLVPKKSALPAELRVCASLRNTVIRLAQSLSVAATSRALTNVRAMLSSSEISQPMSNRAFPVRPMSELVLRPTH